MKKLYILFTLIFVMFSSCSNPDDFGLESTQFIYENQKWELVRMAGSFEGSETFGEDMEWQEFYIFSPGGTFIKSRIIDNVALEASGTFDVVEYENDEAHYLELSFVSGEELIGSCTANRKEVLLYSTAEELSSTWRNCDGPSLTYKLVKD